MRYAPLRHNPGATFKEMVVKVDTVSLKTSCEQQEHCSHSLEQKIIKQQQTKKELQQVRDELQKVNDYITLSMGSRFYGLKSAKIASR